jgi:hypothetical protein
MKEVVHIGLNKELVRLFKMSRNEADNKFRMWEFSPDTVPSLNVGEVL